MIQLTYYGKPGYTIDTIHGEVSYLDWLMSEKKRILKNPYRRAEIRKSSNPIQGTRYALFVNRVGREGRCNDGKF